MGQFLMTVIPQALMVLELIAAAIFLGFGYGLVRLIGVIPVVFFLFQYFFRFRSTPDIDDVLENNKDLSLCVSLKTLNDVRTSYHRAILSDLDFELDLANQALSDRETQMMFYRLGVDPLEVEEKILARLNDEVIGIKEDIFSNILVLSEYAARVALKTGSNQVRLVDFLVASVILKHDELARIIKIFGVTIEEMETALLLERTRNNNLSKIFSNIFRKYVYRLIGKKFEIEEVTPRVIKFFDDELVISALDNLGKGKPVFILEQYKTESVEFVEQMATLIKRQRYFLGRKIIVGENITRKRRDVGFPRRDNIFYFKNFDSVKNLAVAATISDAAEDGVGIIIALAGNEINRAEKAFGGSPTIRLPKMKDEELERILAQRAGLMEEVGLRITVSAIKETVQILERYFSESLLVGEQIIYGAISQASRGGNKFILAGDILKSAEKLYSEEVPTGYNLFKKEVSEELFEVGMMRKVSDAAALYLLQYRARLWHETIPISFFVLSGDRVYCEKIREICLKSVLGTNWTHDQMMEIDALKYKDAQIETLIGSEDQKVYGRLTEFIADNPRSVIVIENFSQGSAPFMKMIYQMIKDGWIMDGRGRLIDATGLLLLTFDCGITSDNSIVDYQKFLTVIGNKK